MARLFAILSLVAFAFGCGQSPTSVAPKPTGHLTADDLAHANHITWWIVNVPDAPKGKTLCMSFVDKDGIVESRACPGVKRGDRVKLVLSGFSDWNLRYSLVTHNNAFRSTISNHFRGFDGPSTERHSGAEVNVGEFIVKKSNENQVTGIDTALQPTEIGLTFTFEDDARPWRREGYKPPGDNWLIDARRDAETGN